MCQSCWYYRMRQPNPARCSNQFVWIVSVSHWQTNDFDMRMSLISPLIPAWPAEMPVSILKIASVSHWHTTNLDMRISLIPPCVTGFSMSENRHRQASRTESITRLVRIRYAKVAHITTYASLTWRDVRFSSQGRSSTSH
jgi:hypothetical protein